MHPTLEKVVAELRKLANQISVSSSETRSFNVMGGNWSFPGISKDDLVHWATDLADEIEASGLEDLGSFESTFENYRLSLDFLRGNTVQYLWNGNTAPAVAAITSTFEGLARVFRSSLPEDASRDAVREFSGLRRRIRSLGSRLDQLDPRTADLEAMIDRIIEASQAADAMPEDLESLKELRFNAAVALERARRDATLAEQAKNLAADAKERLDQIELQANQVLAKCDEAYSAHTSQGLAQAFQEKANTLTVSTWVWASGLAAALLFAAFQGGDQLKEAAKTLTDGSSNGALGVSLGMVLVKLGAPIWFAWLATKQIGQRFRLAEDYAFKAAIARAYEGYRKEAARIDGAMEAKLLASALARLDEQPLRVVESISHGSPWHELMTSDAVKKALATGPNFIGKVKALAEATIAKVPQAGAEPKGAAATKVAEAD